MYLNMIINRNVPIAVAVPQNQRKRCCILMNSHHTLPTSKNLAKIKAFEAVLAPLKMQLPLEHAQPTFVGWFGG